MISNTKKNNTPTKTHGNHNGDVTHHQDQLATSPIPANFKVKNTMKIIVPRLPDLYNIIFLSFIF